MYAWPLNSYSYFICYLDSSTELLRQNSDVIVPYDVSAIGEGPLRRMDEAALYELHS